MNEMQDVLDFWFKELSVKEWYMKDPQLDTRIRERFGRLHTQATKGELFEWRSSFDGRVAEIVILDQFSRNLFRDKPEAFAFDMMALTLAQEAVRNGILDEVNDEYKQHILLPYMHSESSAVHKQAVFLKDKYNMDKTYELKHKVIIDRFGRYPHRNEILGRKSTNEELEFLKGPGSSF